MDLNKHSNLINKLSKLTENDLLDVDISLNLVRKQKEADLSYQSSEIAIAPDVKKWLKQNIISTLDSLKKENSDGDKEFLVGDYNHEFSKLDYIASYPIVESKQLYDKKNKLIESLRSTDALYPEKDTNFQIVTISYELEEAHFCFYRRTKKNSSKKKKQVLRNSNEYVFVDQPIIDLGGNIDFIIFNTHLFIMNVTSFEYAFDYRDHINEKRDENITSITSMPFFEGKGANPEEFEKSCKKYVHSRGLAQIKTGTLKALQENFEARCKELSKIKKKVPKDPKEREIFISKLGTIWKLMDYIDVENYKVIYKEGDSPTPLIHFFADKIVKSFLTEDIKVAISYES